jgi:diadenylate cyclase
MDDVKKVKDGPARSRSGRQVISRPQKDIHIVVMEGDMDEILDRLRAGKGLPINVTERCLDILIGLSLKGYEGKAIGAIYLIGDIEGVKKNSTQMIINPFKGWDKINVMDATQQPTFEAFTQLDGAILIDKRGYAKSAGMMIHVKGWQIPNHEIEQPQSTRGRGTRWRAARYITSITGTVALTLSNSGDIAVFVRGKEIGRLERKIKRVSPDQAKAIFGWSC